MHPRHPRIVAASLAAGAVLAIAPAASAEASGNRTDVRHDVTYSEYFPDDICGERGSFTTFTAKVQQQQLVERPDGSWSYRDVSVVTYVSDYDDPALPDLTGRLTEVNHYVLTPGGTFIASEAFHDFFGDVKIWWKLHLTVVDGEPVVDRFIVDVTGCP